MFTIIFLSLELQMIVSTMKDGRSARLWWLPLLFLVWASVHVQLIYGLFVLGLFAVERIVNKVVRYNGESATLPTSSLWVLGASFLATLINPYGWGFYSTTILYASQKKSYDIISELQSIPFREPHHFALLFLALAGAAALGWRRDLRPTYLILLLVSATLAFRSRRDIWFLAIVCVCLIADTAGKVHVSGGVTPFKFRERVALAVLTVAVLAVGWQHYNVSNEFIEMGMAGKFPVGAARYVEIHHLKGPLYNDFSAGGYLIWRLPSIPVSIDGRINIHGDDRPKAYTDALMGLPGWEKDPDLATANLIIWPKKSALPGLLRCDPRFKLVYEDPQAVVFVRR